METQIKKTVKAGNSSAVILPKSWLNKEVKVELIKKTPELILQDVIKIINNYVNLKYIIGIYLVGSRARGEEDENSDIDILVVTKGIDKELIKNGSYSILIVSSELLEQKLKNDILPIGPMIKEAKPLINEEYIKSLMVKITKNNIKWYIETTQKKLGIIDKVLKNARIKKRNNLSDLVAYTLILRIRTLYFIEKLIKNEKYSKNEFIKLIEKISDGKNAYERYLATKNDSKDKKKTVILESEKLYNYLKSYLVKIKNMASESLH